MPKVAPITELTQDQIEAIQRWEATKRLLDETKASELLQRMEIVRTAPFDQDKEQGGQTLKLGAGWRLALDKPMDYKIESKNNDKVLSCLRELDAKNPLATIDLIRWEPVMSVSAYKKLSDEEKLILAPVVTMKPGTPSLELKPPAAPKA